LKAFLLLLAFPAADVGPVLFWALARFLAARCSSVSM
jgi:hypothetical protein